MITVRLTGTHLANGLRLKKLSLDYPDRSLEVTKSYNSRDILYFLSLLGGRGVCGFSHLY